jgi:hypothetical protein
MGGDDYTVTSHLHWLSGNGYVGPAARVVDATHYWAALYHQTGGGVELTYRDGGVLTVVTTAPYNIESPGQNDPLVALQNIGNQHIVRINGAVVIDVLDAHVPSGHNPGLVGQQTGLDNDRVQWSDVHAHP